MDIKVINIEQKFDSIKNYWEPKIAGHLNGQMIKLAKFKDEFIMHHHENEDEMFLVVKGHLFMELEDKTLEIKPGEFIIIPRGINHKPFAKDETWVMLFEPATTLNTGQIQNELTQNELEEI